MAQLCDIRTSRLCLTIFALLVILNSSESMMIGSRKIIGSVNLDGNDSEMMNQVDPLLNVFFSDIKDLNVGKKFPIFFPIKNTSQTPKLLSNEVVDSIPFSLSKLPYLLQLFSYSVESPQARAMEETLEQCEHEAMKRETKFCATSLESLLDLTSDFFGVGLKLIAITTNYPSNFTTPLQNYTILEKPREIRAPKLIHCHSMAYPYMVYYCHSQESDNLVFKVPLVGENGDRVEAAAICHMDTSHWDSDHIGFRALKIKPGTSPVCHFYPADNLVWIPLCASHEC